MLIDVPGATPSQLVLALGKDGNAYLLNRNNLGGIAAPVASLSVGWHGQRPVVGYPTIPAWAPILCFAQRATSLRPTRLPQLVRRQLCQRWSVTQNGQGSPWVTTTDGTNNAIVWVVGAQGDGQLHGYDGDTGAVIYRGADVMSGTRKWNSGIVARGSIYVANDNKVYAFPCSGRNAYTHAYSTATATATVTPTATATATPTSTPTATASCGVRQRHPDQRPLRDPVRHRGRGRLRRQGRA